MILYIFAGVVFIVSIVIATIYIVKSRSIEEYPPNLPIVQNYLSTMTGGRFDLIQVGLEQGNSGRLLFYGIPKDIYYSEDRDIKKEIIKIPIPWTNYRVKEPGLMSKERTHILLLPKHTDKLTSSPELNKIFGDLIDEANVQRALIESSIKSYNNITEHVKDFALGDMSLIQIKSHIDRLNMLYEKKLSDEEKDFKMGEDKQWKNKK